MSADIFARASATADTLSLTSQCSTTDQGFLSAHWESSTSPVLKDLTFGSSMTIRIPRAARSTISPIEPTSHQSDMIRQTTSRGGSTNCAASFPPDGFRSCSGTCPEHSDTFQSTPTTFTCSSSGSMATWSSILPAVLDGVAPRPSTL
jgi:hypothetical protein